MINLIIDYCDDMFTLRRSNQEDYSSFNQDGFKWAFRCAKKILRYPGYRHIIITPAAANQIDLG